MNKTKRDHLIDSFLKLVSQKGVTASGVDTIAKFANVSKKTIYNQFGSKESLAEEAILRFSNTVRESWVHDCISIQDPKALLIQFFTELEVESKEGVFYGCIFVNMCREYPEPDHVIHKAAVTHKEALYQEFKERLDNLGITDHKKRLNIELIYEGLLSKLLVYQDAKMVIDAKEIVLELLDD